jgi:hypothetical protein
MNRIKKVTYLDISALIEHLYHISRKLDSSRYYDFDDEIKESVNQHIAEIDFLLNLMWNKSVK